MTVPALEKPFEAEDKQGPFAEVALALLEYGLCPIPVGGENDKTPLVRKFTSWSRRPGAATITDWTAKFNDANVGISCGLSNITVVDIDDPQIVDDMIERFGETPLMTSTPSGGVHLWYRLNGERCQNLRRYGLAVDVKGAGGFVVVPPSIRRSGDNVGKSYRFCSGSWSDLPRLPLLRTDSLSFGRDQNTSPSLKPDGCVTEGERNDTLFLFAKSQALYCDSSHDLFDVAQTRNMEFDPPLPDHEVGKVVASVWRYAERGQLWIKGDAPRVLLLGGNDGVLAVLYENPDGLALYCKLKEVHWDRQTPFPVSTKAMFRDNVIPSFGSHRRYLNALRWLIEKGLLIQTHKGGRGTGDPNLFTFPSEKGVNSTPNITKTPAPPAPAAPCGWGDMTH